MNEKVKLEGWYNIARFLSVSERTAMRYGKEKGLPYYTIKGVKGVFAYEDEVKEWQESLKKKTTKISNETTENNKANFAIIPKIQKKLISISIITISLIVTISSITFFTNLKGSNPKPPQKLLYNIKHYSSGNIFQIIDSAGKQLYSICDNYRHDLTISKENYCLDSIAFSDFNNDGKEDFVYAQHNLDKDNKLEFYCQNNNNGFYKYTEWSTSCVFNYNNNKYIYFTPRDIELNDINSDGKTEIILTQICSPYYPSVCRVFDLDKNTILTIWHPGHFRNILVCDMDNNGKKELYLTGTNNFLDWENDGGAPFILKIETDWNKRGQVVNLFGENYSLTNSVPKGIKITYVFLRKDKFHKGIFRWSFAITNDIIKNSNKSLIHVNTGFCNHPNKKLKIPSRCFLFDENLKLQNSFYLHEFIDIYSPDTESEKAKELLIPLYWNGESWQKKTCQIPQQS